MPTLPTGASVPISATSAERMPALRQDIQVLRGLAVLLVVVFHAGIGTFPAGYLGVDVFFVISGFLITSLIASAMEQGRFSLRGFYFRRAKRLLPAAYVTIGLTVLAAHWFLDVQELRDLMFQVIGAVSFTANIVLWQQAGYFEGAADLKPLLHTWSLSLEEQYYLLIPSAMLALPRRLWMKAAIGALLGSLSLCLLGAVFKPVATFYLLPTRAWELLVGSVAALAARGAEADGRCWSSRATIRALFFPSLLALTMLPVFPIGSSHPGAGAMLACAATAVVLLRRHPSLESSRLAWPLARVGDISYSLYLVHWPIMALLRNAWGNSSAEVPLHFRIAALITSLAVGVMLYRLVERPVHRARWVYSSGLVGATALCSFLLMALVPLMRLAGDDPAQDRAAAARQANQGFSKECDFDGAFKPGPVCRSQAGARVLVWGDSFAMHLIPGLDSDSDTGGVIQATMNTCGPFLDLAPVKTAPAAERTLYDPGWARRCIAFNDSVLEFARRSSEIKIVVLSSLLTAYTDATGWRHLQRDAVQGALPLSAERAQAALLATAAALRAAGKRVVFIAPPPIASFDIGVCLERLRTGRIALGASPRCEIDAVEYRQRRHEVIALLDAVQGAGLPVISFDALLCAQGVCRTMLDETPLYRDYGHLSHDGAIQLAKTMKLGRRIIEAAQ